MVSVIVSDSKPSIWWSVRAISAWPLQRWAVALTTAVGTALLVGVPTAVVHSRYFTRMTAVLWWNYPVWIVSSALAGVALATSYRPRGKQVGSAGVTGGGVLTALAVGCPSCNSLVVAALGTSGALSIWAPLQPVVAISAMVLLAYAVLRRLRAEQVSLTPTGRAAAALGKP